MLRRALLLPSILLFAACGSRAESEDPAASARAASTACRDLVGAYATRVRAEGVNGFVYTTVVCNEAGVCALERAFD